MFNKGYYSGYPETGKPTKEQKEKSWKEKRAKTIKGVDSVLSPKIHLDKSKAYSLKFKVRM